MSACGKPASPGGDPPAGAAPGAGERFTLEVVAGASPGVSPERVLVEGDRVTVIRPHAVQEGTPIGLFGTTLAGDERARLEAAAQAATGRGGNVAPGTPSALVVLLSGERRVEARLALPAASPEAGALLSAIDRLQQRALAAPPLAAVRLELAPPPAPPAEGRPAPMRIAVVNAGSAALTVAFDGAAPRLEATEPRPPPDPTVTPLPAVWDRVSPDAAQRGPFPLPPGGRAELAVQATFEDAGRFEVWARFEGGVTITEDGRQPVHLLGSAMSKPIAITVAPR